MQEYIKLWNIPVCQAGVSWQEVNNWDRQKLACRDVINVLGRLNYETIQKDFCLLNSQLLGAASMARNELEIIESNLKKVIARLNSL